MRIKAQFFRPRPRDYNDAREGKILAVVPSGFCFGLQNLTLALFARITPQVKVHFLNTKWNDGEFPRRLQRLGIPQSFTWLGMFSRRVDWANVKMTLECLYKLPVAYYDFVRLYWHFSPTCIYVANHHEVILLWPLLVCLRHKVVCHLHDPPPSIVFQKITSFFWRRAVSTFVFVSHSVRHRFLRLGALTERNVVVHNGIEIRELILPRHRSNRFCEQFSWPSTSVIIGLTGQLSPHKGHEDFLAAADILKNEPSLRFVIAGRQQEPFLSHLKHVSAIYGIRDKVGFAGWLSESREFFEAIDVFVLASRHEEGFGLVAAEAAERGLPVVCTRSGGVVEIVTDGLTGIVVEKNSPAQIASAVRRLAADPGLRMAMGRAGRSKVCKEFDIDVQAARVASLLVNS
jgi:glycosyltransferase involved in cell wall biosynthesis